MRNHRYRHLAKTLLAIFVLNVCFVFSTDTPACDIEALETEVRVHRYILRSRIRDRDNLEAGGYMKSVVVHIFLGGLVGASGGWHSLGIGMVVGGWTGAWYHYDELKTARNSVRESATALAQAQHNLSACQEK